LADLLANIVHRGVGLIIESHSEHLLLRLRRLVAEQRISGDDVALYFVEPAGYQSRIRQVGIDRFGFIDPRAWPNEFFEDALRESMALAQAQVRERRRETRERRRGERAEGSSNGDGDAR
jgi:predicted ATPase